MSIPWANDASVVDQDIYIASVFLDKRGSSFYRLEIGYVAYYVFKDGGAVRLVCRVGLELVDSIAKYLLSATENIDLLGTVLVERGSNGKSKTCSGVRKLCNVPLPPPVMTTTSPLAEKRLLGCIGAVTSIMADLMRVNYMRSVNLASKPAASVGASQFRGFAMPKLGDMIASRREQGRG